MQFQPLVGLTPSRWWTVVFAAAGLSLAVLSATDPRIAIKLATLLAAIASIYLPVATLQWIGRRLRHDHVAGWRWRLAVASWAQLAAYIGLGIEEVVPAVVLLAPVLVGLLLALIMTLDAVLNAASFEPELGERRMPTARIVRPEP